MTIKQILSVVMSTTIMISSFSACTKTEKPQNFDFQPESAISETITTEEETTANTRGYSVSCSSDIATDIAMAVLESGGNAVDAAVALSYTLSVVEQYASGLGGSGAMLVYDSNTGKCDFYDYRACSGSGEYSLIGVPGFVKGMEAIHKDYGTVDIKKLIEPAATYAENGFEINKALENRIYSASGTLSSNPEFCNEDGSLLSSGDTLIQKNLASTLRKIQQEGSDVFYKGEIAQHIADATPLTLEDLSSYEINKSSALKGEFSGYTIYSGFAPLCGATVIQMLKMAEAMDIPDPEKDPTGYLTDLERLTALAYSDRYYTICDPAFYDSDTDVQDYLQSLITDEYIDYMLKYGSTDAANLDQEKPETTSYCIIDSNGLVVSSTNTLSSFWGSQLLVDGFFLNNTNVNFSSHSVNVYQANKRSRTFTAPTIVTGDNGYILAVGTPGGNNIPSVLFNVLIDVLKFKEEPQAAVEKARFLYRDGMLTIEADQEGTTWLDLSQVPHSYIWHETGYWWGSVSLVGYSETDGAFAAYDYRRGATKAGIYNPDNS